MRGEPGAVRVLAAVALAASVVGSDACGWIGGGGAGAPNPTDLEAIGALTGAFVDAHNEGDVDRLANLFTGDAILAHPDEPTCEGRDAIADYFDDLLRDAPATAECDVQEVRIADDWAFERLDVTFVETDPDTGEEIETRVRYLWILERQPDGGWKIARLIGNLEEPGEAVDQGTGEGRQV